MTKNAKNKITIGNKYPINKSKQAYFGGATSVRVIDIVEVGDADHLPVLKVELLGTAQADKLKEISHKFLCN